MSKSDIEIDNNLYIDKASLGNLIDNRNWPIYSYDIWKDLTINTDNLLMADANSIEANAGFRKINSSPSGTLNYSDLEPEISSPSVDTGGPLTYTVYSGSGTTVPVKDSRYFCDGFGIIKGDKIRVGSSPTATILEVDYTDHKIIIDKNITWKKSDSVVISYAGTAPDIGAWEASAAWSGDQVESQSVSLNPPKLKIVSTIFN
jgi:hypothetical protein